MPIEQALGWTAVVFFVVMFLSGIFATGGLGGRPEKIAALAALFAGVVCILLVLVAIWIQV